MRLVVRLTVEAPLSADNLLKSGEAAASRVFVGRLRAPGKILVTFLFVVTLSRRWRAALSSSECNRIDDDSAAALARPRALKNFVDHL